MNLVGTAGEDWKRHRRVCGGAFNRNTYRAVWDTTADVYREMVVREGWASMQRTGVIKANEITHKVRTILGNWEEIQVVEPHLVLAGAVHNSHCWIRIADEMGGTAAR